MNPAGGIAVCCHVDQFRAAKPVEDRMPASRLPSAPDLRRQSFTGGHIVAQRTKSRRRRKAGVQQPVIDGGNAEHHRRFEALDRFRHARRSGPALKQDVACAHPKRGEHVADRVSEVEP
jgi:hypothetical protein